MQQIYFLSVTLGYTRIGSNLCILIMEINLKHISTDFNVLINKHVVKKDTLVMFIKEQFDLSRFTSEIPCDVFTDKIIQI